jgi:lipopolysaccharide cholinephosphotransferase
MQENQNTYLTLREIQLSELEILKELALFFEQNNLSYSLHGGTLLGAVRHKGFIPWDDDIDVCMPRPDYERFRAISEQLPDHLFFIDETNTEYELCFGKVCKKNIIAVESEGLLSLKRHLWVDVFPIDAVPNAYEEQVKIKKLSRKLLRKKRILCYKGGNNRDKRKRIRDKIWATPFNGLRKKLVDRRLKKIFNSLDYEQATYVADLAGAGPSYTFFKKEDLESPIVVEFEGCKFKAIRNPEFALSGWYGENFMELPPESERVTHHIQAWRIEEK